MSPNDTPLVWWLYSRLYAVLPPPPHHNFPMQIDVLAEVNLAAQELSRVQVAALSEPGREVSIRLLDRHGGRGWVSLLPVALLALLQPGLSIRVTRQQEDAIRTT